MGRIDRTVRLLVGFALVYFGFIQHSLTDSHFINQLSGFFGLTNIVSSLLGICPAYLLANISTRRNSQQYETGSQSHRVGQVRHPNTATSTPIRSLKSDSLLRNLLLSITLPVGIVLAVFTYLFFELSANYREESDLIAANSIAEMALHIESSGQETLYDYRTNSMLAIIFHDAYGNIIPTVLEKFPSDVELKRELISHLALDKSNPNHELQYNGRTISKTTDSLPDQGLHVSVFYTNSAKISAIINPILSRLLFVAVFALWLSGWTAHYIIKRYTDYVSRSAETIRYRSTHDLLTGLQNRTGLEESLQQRVIESEEHQSFCVITVDIANFHYFNDTLGHKLGDQLLIEISNRLKQVVTANESLARLNGDEFAVVVDIFDDKDLALSRAEEIKDIVCKPIKLGEIRIDIECNIGLSIYPIHSTDSYDLIRLSNIALHNTKAQSRSITTYNAEEDKNDSKSVAVITGLQTAIESNQLYLVYQPKIDLNSGELRGVEALLRWQHPVYQNVPPDEFIGWAEKSGSINQITQWVLAKAEEQSRQWLQQGLTIPIAINLSPINLEDEQTLKIIEDSVSEGCFKGGLLELELTENAVVREIDKALVKMRELQALGVPISIDDFGTGLASFSYLRNFPVTNLKIDRSFVNVTDPDDHDLVVLRSMIELGHNLNCVVTAEGVENEVTMELLRSCGCDFAQGYHICRPILPHEIERWIETEDIQLFDGGRDYRSSSGDQLNAA